MYFFAFPLTIFAFPNADYGCSSHKNTFYPLKAFLMFWQDYLWSQNNESEFFYSGKIHSRNAGKIKD